MNNNHPNNHNTDGFDIVYFASDHAGFSLKEILVRFVRNELHLSVEDLGASELVSEDDYPDFVAKAAQLVSKNPDSARAIILGGSGQGEAIVANRLINVRAAVIYSANKDIVRLSREHNNANILSIGARFISESDAKEAVSLWLKTPFTKDERHVRRIAKIEEAT